MLDLVGKDLGRYHILERLGEGGMATVYKAYDTRLERHVALKVIRPDVGQGEEMLKRFEREAKALAQLTHPNIVHINDYGEQGGLPYVVMDFLPGGTLKQKLGQPMAFPEAARLLAPIARALEYAHQQKIIHRDVKPANILLTQSNAPMLSDFGIAKILESRSKTELTATGAGIGTPEYMAPEQWLGKAESRTDIYALGIVFYELVTGRRPYTADTPAAILLKHINDPLPSPRQFVRDLPYQVEQVLNKALAKNPEDRFQTMGEFADRLEQLATSSRVGATRTVSAANGGATELVQPAGTSMKPPANWPAAGSRSPATPPPPSRPYVVPGSYSGTGSYPNTGASPATGPRPATGPYSVTGAVPEVIPQKRNPRVVWLIAGLSVVLALCLIGGIAGGAYIVERMNLTATGPLPTSLVLASADAGTSTVTLAAALTETPPPPSAQVGTETSSAPLVPTPMPIPPIATATGHSGAVASIAFSPDGQWLASGSDDKTVRLWKWNGTAIDYLLELQGHTNGVVGVAFSPDGSKLATASRDNTVRVWAPQTASLLQTLEGHTAAVRSVAFSPDGRFLASGSEDGTVRLWKADTGELVQTLRDASAAPDERVFAIAFSPDAQTLAAAGTATRLWSVSGPADQPLRRLNVSANAVAFSPDGRTFATGGASIQIWDSASGQIQRSMGSNEKPELSVAFSPDGQRLAAGNESPLARAWNTATGALQLTFSGPEADVKAVAFSPDGRYLAGVSTDKVVRVWQVQANAVPTFTPWPPTDTPTSTPVPPTKAPTKAPTKVPTKVPTAVPPTAVVPSDTPFVISVTPPPPVITLVRPILTLRIFIPTATPTPTLGLIIRPILTAPIILLP